MTGRNEGIMSKDMQKTEEKTNRRMPTFTESVIPIIATIYGYNSLYTFFGGKLFNSSLAKLIKPSPFVYTTSGILILIGIMVGMIGSYRAVRKYLKI